MEQLLHYVWKHRIFPLQSLRTTDGLEVEVIDAGLQNSHAGPDFFNAKLKIGGTLWVGNVEIHSVSSAWFQHRHNADRSYDSVILHVVGKADCPVFRTDGTPVPQLELPCPEQVCRHFDRLMHSDVSPRCYTLLPSLPSLTVHSWFSALLHERLQLRTQQFMERLERSDRNWEDTFFITLARNFGFGLNGDTFERWAYKIPFRCVDKIRDDQTRVEVLFLGMAGLLESPVADDYSVWMQREFRYLQHAYELPAPVDAALWKLLRTRPNNFPHVRLSQLAAVYTHERGLFSRILETATLDDLRKILSTSASSYWDDHYQFGKPVAARSSKRVGKRALDLIIINTVVPALYAYGLYRGDDCLCERAVSFLEKLPPEENYVTRMWRPLGIQIESAADTQALLQLQKQYCESRKCLYCRFGFEYMRKSGD